MHYLATNCCESMSKKTHHWQSSLYSRIIRWRRQRWIWRQSWGFWLGSGSARTKQRNLWSKDCKNGFRMLRSRTSTLCKNVLLYYSLPESQCNGNSNFLLKFRKFQNKFSFWNFLTFTTHKITNQLTLIDAGFWRSFFWEKWSLSFLHFLSNEDHCILYESWDVQLTFETLINAVGYKL